MGPVRQKLQRNPHQGRAQHQQVKPGLLGIIGIGDLEFSSSASDKAEIVFKTIAHATAVRDLVRQHQEP